MAKIVKKKPAAKAATKSAKKAPAKAVPKAAAKKPAPKAVVKKKVEKTPAKAPAKVAKKVEVKKKASPVKVAPKVASKVAAKPVKAAAKPQKPAKVEAPAKKAEKIDKAEKVEKKTNAAPPEVVVEKASAKKDSKPVSKKAKAKKEKEENIEDDFISDDDMGGEDIGEYEEELKAVEELDEDVDVEEEWVEEDKTQSDDEIILTDAEGRRYCRARDCDQIAAVDAYCRYHYLMFWKKIQIRKKILQDGKLERYVEELTSRYPDKFLEMIRRDLRTEKDFLGAIQELEIDESAVDNEFEEDNSAFIEEVRGMGEGSSSGVDEDDY